MKLAPFEGPRAKVMRARQHLASLERQVEDYIRANPVAVHIDGTGGNTAIDFPLTGEIPIDIPLTIGDLVHNLRSALDLMACDVVLMNGGGTKNVYFPFANSKGELDERIKSKKFDRAHPDAVKLLREMEPYPGGLRALRLIHDLDIDDKHVMILPVAQAAQVPNIQVAGITFTNCTFAEAESTSIFVDGGAPISVNGSPALTLHFPSDAAEGLRREAVLPTLHRLTDSVAGCIEAFAQLLLSGRADPDGSPIS